MFSDSLREAVQTYDGNFFIRHQDNTRMLQRTGELAGIEGEELEKAKEVMEYFSLPEGILLGRPSEGTHWSYVEINRVRERDGKLLVQLRVHDEEFTFDYLEFLVERRRYKTVESLVISDYYSYNSGQWVSEGIGEMASFLQYTKEDSLGQAEYGRAKDQIASDYQRGNFSLGEKGYAALPPEEKKDRLLNRVRLQVASEQEDSIYKAVLAEYEAMYPGDMSIFGLQVEYAYGNKDYNAILERIRHYESLLGGGDAYTYWMQGDVMVYMEQSDSAFHYLDKSIALEPQFDPPLISRFYLQLDLKDYAGALKTFKNLEGLGYKLDNLDLKEYPDFLNSVEFADWAEGSAPLSFRE